MTSSHERVADLLRRQQSTTARLRAGLPALIEQLESLEEPEIGDIVDLRGDVSAEHANPPSGSSPAG